MHGRGSEKEWEEWEERDERVYTDLNFPQWEHIMNDQLIPI